MRLPIPVRGRRQERLPVAPLLYAQQVRLQLSVQAPRRAQAKQLQAEVS